MKTFFSLIGVAAAAAHDFKVCSGVPDQLGVSAVDLTPDPPKGGSNLAVNIKGKTSIGVSGGQAVVQVKVLGVVIDTLKFDLCKEISISPACPIAAGSAWSATVNYPIPGAAPSGATAGVEVKINDANAKEVSCVDLSVKIGAGLNATLPTDDCKAIGQQCGGASTPPWCCNAPTETFCNVDTLLCQSWNEPPKPMSECANTEYCCPDAKHCLTPTKVTCANGASVCKDSQVCCPLTKLCVDVGAACTPQCTDGGFCCPDALHCLTPVNAGKICDSDAACGAGGVCCPLIHQCVKVGVACTP